MSSYSTAQHSEAAAHFRANAGLSPKSGSGGSGASLGYSLNSAHYRAPGVTPGKVRDRAKRRDTHLTAVHNLADVLELNPFLASAAAAMRLPTRTKVVPRVLWLRSTLVVRRK